MPCEPSSGICSVISAIVYQRVFILVCQSRYQEKLSLRDSANVGGCLTRHSEDARDYSSWSIVQAEGKAQSCPDWLERHRHIRSTSMLPASSAVLGMIILIYTIPSYHIRSPITISALIDAVERTVQTDTIQTSSLIWLVGSPGLEIRRTLRLLHRSLYLLHQYNRIGTLTKIAQMKDKRRSTPAKASVA